METSSASSAGLGSDGASGGGGGVAKDHSAPGVEPVSFFATTCQWYVVP